MMKTIKGTIGAGKTTTLVNMLNGSKGKTLMIQNDTIPLYIVTEFGYKGELLSVGTDLEDVSFFANEPYDNIGIDLHGITQEQKEQFLNKVKKYAAHPNTNIIVTEYARDKKSKYLEVV